MGRIRRPSPSLVISLIALSVAIAGTAYAATKINGKSLKNASVAGKKLKADTLTGKQINESSLGTVPKATDAEKAANATNADNAAKVGGFTISSATVSVTLPAFTAGQNQCKSVQAAVPGAQPGDNILMTPAGDVTWTGNDQAAITAHAVSAGQVEVQACLSADAAPPFTPTATNYKFLIIR